MNTAIIVAACSGVLGLFFAILSPGGSTGNYIALGLSSLAIILSTVSLSSLKRH